MDLIKIISNIKIGNCKALAEKQPRVMFRFGGSVIHNYSQFVFVQLSYKTTLKYTSPCSHLQPLSLVISSIHSSHIACEGTEELQINYNKSRQKTEKGFTYTSSTLRFLTQHSGQNCEGHYNYLAVYVLRYSPCESIICQICHIGISITLLLSSPFCSNAYLFASKILCHVAERTTSHTVFI